MTKQDKSSYSRMPCVPVSWGELIDKITILEIKAEKITSPAASVNIRKELSLLLTIAQPVLEANGHAQGMISRLRAVNKILWDVEERIRKKEAAGAFDSDFIELARSVYKHNDERGMLKKTINYALKSELTEEKKYG